MAVKIIQLLVCIFLYKYGDEKRLTPPINDVCDWPIQKSLAHYQGMSERNQFHR